MRRPNQRAKLPLGVWGLALFLGLTLGGWPAYADWLVTVDGARVKTRGAWEVKGKQVVFTAPNGVFSALPLTEVDLEASEKLTAAAKAPKAEKPAPKPKKKPVLVLTDKDIPKYQAPGEDGAAATDDDGADGVADTGDDVPDGGSELTISDWEIADDGGQDGVTLTGTLVNTTPDAAASIRLVVRIFDETGEQIGQRYAELDRSALPPGESSTWTVTFPQALTVSAVRFDPRSARFRAVGGS